jgi:hypothetical protein
MSEERPTTAPELLAALIASTPERVRQRLDRTPDAATAWTWQATAEAWSVDTGGETVTLPLEHVLSVEQVRCTCLLSPCCFHVLACLTRLEVAILEAAPALESEPADSAGSEADEDVIAPDEKQQHAARELVTNLARLLRVGVANAGVLVQSGLLRAVHQCRAEGLHRLAALGLRVIAGTNEFRARSATSDPAQLAEDVADALETSRHLLGQNAVPSFWIGTARRKQLPVRPRKLHGLFAEPILTRSGFAGAAVYFLGEDGQLYSASDVRPGDARRARDAYLGGIEIGPLTQPAKQLARGLYLGSDMTASRDGRLGRGKNIKIADQGPSTWEAESIQERFRRSLPEQWDAAYAQAALPADARPAGWDFVFLQGTILGAAGPEVLFQLATHGPPMRLAIENESEILCFRENLRMLCHAPGLRLQLIARVSLQEPGVVSPLAIAAVEPSRDPPQQLAQAGDVPTLEPPASLAGRVCLGFDELQRPFFKNARPAPVIVGERAQFEREDPLGPLRRRWIAAVLSGLISQSVGTTTMLAIEIALLDRTGFATAAALLDALSRAPSDDEPAGVDTFLATAVYLRSCGNELAKSRAMPVS